MLIQVQIWSCTSGYFMKDTCILPRVCGSFLCGKEIRVANGSVTCILGEANCGHICSSRWSHNEAEGIQQVQRAAENGSAKVTRHLLDHKVVCHMSYHMSCHCGYIIFAEGRITKYMYMCIPLQLA